MIPYIENFLTQAEADALFESVLSQPAVREKNARNNSSLRKIHYGTYSPIRRMAVNAVRESQAAQRRCMESGSSTVDGVPGVPCTS
jgi:hypothetical protein